MEIATSRLPRPNRIASRPTNIEGPCRMGLHCVTYALSRNPYFHTDSLLVGLSLRGGEIRKNGAGGWKRSGFGRFLLLRGGRIWEVGVAKPSFFVLRAKVLAKLLERQHTPESQKPSVLPILTTEWRAKLFFARSLERERTWLVAQK